MKRPGRGGRRRALFVALALAVSSCATLPEAREPEAGWAGLLPPDDLAYIGIDVTDNRSVVKSALAVVDPDGALPPHALDRVKRLLLGVAKGPSGEIRYALVLLGSFPPGLVDFRLSLDPDWSRAEGGYWQNRHSGLQVALPGRSVMLVSNGGIPGLLARARGTERGLVLSPATRERFEASDIALYVAHPGRLAGAPPGTFPVSSLMVSLTRSGLGAYGAEASIATSSDRTARAYAVILRLLSAESVRGASALLSTLGPAGDLLASLPLSGARVEVEGSGILVSGVEMTEESIDGLIAKIGGGAAWSLD